MGLSLDKFDKQKSAANLVRWLFSSHTFDIKLFNQQTLRNFFINQTKEFLDEFRHELQTVILKAARRYHTNNNKFYLNAVISSALAYLPYTYPETNTEFIYPQFIDDQLKLIKYKIKKIQITPTAIGSPYHIYLMEPHLQYDYNCGANNYLLFMGTNPSPAASGYHLTLMSDSMIGYNVGEFLYVLGKPTINKIIDQYGTYERPLVLVGHSLGGSTAMLIHMHMPKNTKVIACNSPCLLKNMERVYKENLAKANLCQERHKAELCDKITIYTQPGDLVFLFGTYIPKLAQVFLISSKNSDKYWGFSRHSKCYASHEHHLVECVRVCPKTESVKFIRKIITFIWQLVCLPLTIIHFVLLAIKYVLNKMITFVNFIIKNFISLSSKLVNICAENYNKGLNHVKSLTLFSLNNQAIATPHPEQSYHPATTPIFSSATSLSAKKEILRSVGI